MKIGDIPIALHLAGSREEYRFVKYGAAVGSDERFDLHGFMEIPPWLPTAVTLLTMFLTGADSMRRMLLQFTAFT